MPQGPEMTQWLRTLAVLKDDPAAAGSYSYLSVTPISGGSDALFWLCMYCICVHIWYTDLVYIHSGIHLGKIPIYIKVKF